MYDSKLKTLNRIEMDKSGTNTDLLANQNKSQEIRQDPVAMETWAKSPLNIQKYTTYDNDERENARNEIHGE